MSHVNKKNDELAVDLVKAWLAHESEVSNEIGRTCVKGESKSVKEVAQAYLNFSQTIFNNELPTNLTEKN